MLSSNLASIVSSGQLEQDREQLGSKFMTTSQVLQSFGVGMKPAKHGARVVYMDGSWDMFHHGHVQILQQALAMGDHLVVGVFSDNLVNRRKGANFPIMNLN